MMITQDPRALVYRKYALQYVRELMVEVLTATEETTVLLHCGIFTGDPITFWEIAKLLRLYSAEGAEELYGQAVRKTREAIPGSKLRNGSSNTGWHITLEEKISSVSTRTYLFPSGSKSRFCLC